MDNTVNHMNCCVVDGDTYLGNQETDLSNQRFWNQKWENKETGWDIGYASPAVTAYMDQYVDKDAAILIPGCGNAHEASYLLENGFTNITLIDIAPAAVATLKEKFSGNKQVKVLCGDFFLHEGQYDLIIEQTFFCAIRPNRRAEYVSKAASLLNENGKIIGVLFDREFNYTFPPFGGSVGEYKSLFNNYFTIKTMNACYNSILPRANSEVFINLVKK